MDKTKQAGGIVGLYSPRPVSMVSLSSLRQFSSLERAPGERESRPPVEVASPLPPPLLLLPGAVQLSASVVPARPAEESPPSSDFPVPAPIVFEQFVGLIWGGDEVEGGDDFIAMLFFSPCDR